eukprot:GHVS01063361.1.p1 GENE.GHVS01063361.1~~GHVS01063361.1.p1  ORF type:complete len:623 (+),score=89.61 GHVS01063361.1:162-2030(+)
MTNSSGGCCDGCCDGCCCDGCLGWKSVFMQRIVRRNWRESECFRGLYAAYIDVLKDNRRLLYSAATTAAAVAAFGSDDTASNKWGRGNTTGTAAVVEDIYGGVVGGGRVSSSNRQHVQEEYETERKLSLQRERSLTEHAESSVRALVHKTSECDTLRDIVRDREDEIAEQEKQIKILQSNCDVLLREQLQLKQQLEIANSNVEQKTIENTEILQHLITFKESEAKRLNDLQSLYLSIIQEQTTTEQTTTEQPTTEQQHIMPTAASCSSPLMSYGQSPKSPTTTSCSSFASSSHSKVVPRRQRPPQKTHSNAVNVCNILDVQHGNCFVKGVAINELLVTGGADGFLGFSHPLSGSVLYSFPVAPTRPAIVAVEGGDSAGSRLLVAAADLTLYLVDREKQRTRATLKGHSNKITGCGYVSSIDKRKGFSVSLDRTLRLWDFERSCSSRTGYATSAITGCAVAPEGHIIATAHQNGSVTFWSLGGGGSFEVETRLESVHSNLVTGLSFSTDGRYLVCQSKDHSVKIIDVRKGKELDTFSAQHFRTMASNSIPRLSADCKYVCASADCVLWIWPVFVTENNKKEPPQEQPPYRITAHGEISCFTWSQPPLGMVTGHSDGTVAFWEP